MKTFHAPGPAWGAAITGTIILMCCVTCGHGTPPGYKIRDLGTFHRSYYSIAIKINDLGHVAGEATTGDADVGGPEIHPFLYTHGPLQDLGLLPGGFKYTFTSDLNNSDQIVGTFYQEEPFVSVAFLYSGGRMLNLTELIGAPFVGPGGLNDRGDIVGVIGPAYFGPFTAFHYASGLVTHLGTLVPGGQSVAVDINEEGTIIGAATTDGAAESSYHAVIYSNGRILDLGTLPGGNYSYGYSINNLGHAVGQAGTADADRYSGFLYRNGTMVELPTAPGDSYFSAFQINDADQVVGISARVELIEGEPTDVRRAALYSDGVTHDLNTLVHDKTGWYLSSALSINQRGEITGIGSYKTQAQRAFILTPMNKP